ncbi:hypothetical protein ACFP81_07210 [Deinococcus lacus]|uniref:Uncharacterized protein n=1 Tax=Deinococcus lacus TaxID=392561 RepID=A0ABW1YBZ1_9DEIO
MKPASWLRLPLLLLVALTAYLWPAPPAAAPSAPVAVSLPTLPGDVEALFGRSRGLWSVLAA